MRIADFSRSSIIQDGIDMCCKELSLKNIPPIEFIDDEPTISHSDKNSFGMFDGNTIWVVTKGRHPIDVVRTIAHELVHLKQQELNLPMSGEDGSNTENDANAIAGVILRRFGEQHPDYFDVE